MVAMRKCNNLIALLLSMNTNEAMRPLLELTSFGKQAHHCTFGQNFIASTGRMSNHISKQKYSSKNDVLDHHK